MIMSDIIKICKKHGELSAKDIRLYIYKGYERKECRLCNKEWDKKRKQDPEYKRKSLLNSQKPENREKQRIYAIAYKERRRVVSKDLYQRKKNNPEFRLKAKEYSNKKYQRMKESFDNNYIKKC